MERLVAVRQPDDIFEVYRNTPIEQFLMYHNFEAPFQTHVDARLLIGMCMDHRHHLRIPDNFAYIIRAAGADLRQSEFKVSYAIAIGGVSVLALLGHTNCGMVNLVSRREEFIQNMVANAGWTHSQAEEHFMSFAPFFEIGNEVDFVLSEARRLRHKYPKILVAPMLYRMEDHQIYLLNDD